MASPMGFMSDVRRPFAQGSKGWDTHVDIICHSLTAPDVCDRQLIVGYLGPDACNALMLMVRSCRYCNPRAGNAPDECPGLHWVEAQFHLATKALWTCPAACQQPVQGHVWRSNSPYVAEEVKIELFGPCFG